ncbi:hypothetical protein LEMLEM_LOCUS5790 [Lemmus lemmus]
MFSPWGQGQAGSSLWELCHSHLPQPGDQENTSEAAFRVQEGHFLCQESCHWLVGAGLTAYLKGWPCPRGTAAHVHVVWPRILYSIPSEVVTSSTLANQPKRCPCWTQSESHCCLPAWATGWNQNCAGEGELEHRS